MIHTIRHRTDPAASTHSSECRTFAFLAIAVAILLMLGTGAAQSDFDWERTGEQAYMVNCVACHQANGTGVPGAFPPLAGHVPEILALEGGRSYLAEAVAHGLQGEIEVGGETYNGSMPAWPQLDDAQLAAVLNHISVSWDNESSLPDDFEPYLPDEAAELRDGELSEEDVYRHRFEIGLPQPAPPEAQAEGADGMNTDAAVDPSEIDPSDVVYDDENGYFTSDQAARGARIFAENCTDCHGSTMRGSVHGPALTNLGFFREWGGSTMTALFSYVESTMPLGNAGRLSDGDYLALMAHWMNEHGYPSGDTPLIGAPAAQDQITIERR